MNNPPLLTFEFLERQPQAAARVLQDIEPGDAAAFVETVPARLAAPVVSRMVLWAAARCVELLAPERAAGVIREMAYQDGTSLLRLVQAQRLETILDELPASTAKKFRVSLRYPAGTVGAWMDHSVSTFPADSRVADGVKFVTERRNRVNNHIFVVADDGRFAGAVSIADLMRSDANTALAAIMDRDVRTLSNRARLATVASLAAWDEHPVLPVVGRRGNVLGGLSRRNLRKGLAEDRASATPTASPSLLAHVFATYFVACAGLLQLFAQPGKLRQPPSIKENDSGRRRNQSR